MSEQAASIIPQRDKPMLGAITLEAEANRRGRVPGFLVFGEHACDVMVDLSRLDDREVILRSAKHRDMYVFSPKMYEAARHLVGLFRDHFPQQTMLELRAMLGEEDADRFLELLGLLENGVSCEPTS